MMYSNNINLTNMGLNENMKKQHPYMMNANQGKKPINNIQNKLKLHILFDDILFKINVQSF